MIMWIRRTVLAAAVATAGGIMTALPARAEETGMGEIATGMQDSHGNPVDAYFTLSLYGGGVNPADPQHVYEPLVSMLWALYAFLIKSQVMILDWVLSLTWVDFFLTPLKSLSDTLDLVLAQLHLRPFMLLILAFVVAILLLRGRTGAGGVELLMGGLVAALGVGLLADPMSLIAGPDGAITHAQGAGMDLAQAVATDGQSLTAQDTSQVRNGLTASLIDTMLRTPHQIINYGAIIDGGPCEDVYDQTLGQEDARLAIGKCDSALQNVADHPNALTVVKTARLLPTALVFALFSLAITVLAVGAVLLAGWCGIKLVWDLLIAIAGSRHGLFRSGANLAVSLGTVILTTAGVPAFMVIVQAIVSAPASTPAAALFRFDVVSTVLLVGVFVFFWIRHRMKKSARALGERLARLGAPRRGGEQPVQGPSPAEVARRGVEMADRLSRLASRFGRSGSRGNGRPRPKEVPQDPPPTPIPSDRPPPGGNPAAQIGPSSKQPQLPPSPGTPGSKSTGQPAPSTPPGSSGDQQQTEPAGDRVKRRLKSTGSLATQAALTVGTGGTSAAVTGSKAALTASKAGTVTKVARSAQVAWQGKDAISAARARTPQNHAVRARLQQVQHLPSPYGGDHVLDPQSGQEYQRLDQHGRRPEVLQPVPARPGHDSEAAARLHQRLGARR